MTNNTIVKNIAFREWQKKFSPKRFKQHEAELLRSTSQFFSTQPTAKTLEHYLSSAQ